MRFAINAKMRDSPRGFRYEHQMAIPYVPRPWPLSEKGCGPVTKETQFRGTLSVACRASRRGHLGRSGEVTRPTTDEEIWRGVQAGIVSALEDSGDPVDLDEYHACELCGLWAFYYDGLRHRHGFGDAFHGVIVKPPLCDGPLLCDGCARAVAPYVAKLRDIHELITYVHKLQRAINGARSKDHRATPHHACQRREGRHAGGLAD